MHPPLTTPTLVTEDPLAKPHATTPAANPLVASVAARMDTALAEQRFDEVVHYGNTIKPMLSVKDHAPIYFTLAAAYKALHTPKEAAAIYQHVIQEDDTNITAYLELGSMAYASGLYTAAESCFQTVIDLEPDTALAYKGLLNTRLKLGHSKDDLLTIQLAQLANTWKAEETRRAAFDSLQTSIVGNCVEKLLDTGHAIAHYYTDDAVAQCFYGNVLFRLGRVPEALRQYEKCLTLFKNDPNRHWSTTPLLVGLSMVNKGLLVWQRFGLKGQKPTQ